MRGYQDDSFTVEEVRGEVVRSLVGFGAEERPEKLLLEVESGDRFEVFLEAWLGFWGQVDEQTAKDVMGDYEGAPRVDYAQRLGLAGRAIEAASCTRTSGEGTCLEIRFDGAALRLRPADPTDPDTGTVLEFVPD